MRVTVLYHDDADGFGAAYACWKGLPNDALTFIPVQYGQDFPDIPATDSLYIVDFSYDRQTCVELARHMGEENVFIIDHHKTAAVALKGLPFAEFNMNYSGAVLTWHHFFPTKAPPAILNFVQDRDLWKWQLPKSKEVNAYISTLQKNFDEWDEFDIFNAETAGEAIIAFQDNQISGSLKDHRMEHIAGHFVPVLNCTANVSEVGNELCAKVPDAPFSVSYCDRADGKRSYSLRSIGDFDVSAIARQYGGGGHKNAAGFTVNAPKIVL